LKKAVHFCVSVLKAYESCIFQAVEVISMDVWSRRD